LIVGSGIGGVIALIIALKKESPSYFVEYFLDYSQKIFKNDTFTKIEDWDKYKYDSKSLIATMKELFGETIMSKCSVPEYPLVCERERERERETYGQIFSSYLIKIVSASQLLIVWMI
jgi:patatin-like phospholipase/acyl hydrolase